MLLLPSEEANSEDRDLGLGYAPLLDGTVRTNDSKRIREAAAVEAKQAEEALRGLMRASKVNKLKEVRAAADRSTLNKKRYTLWEAAMRELIVEAKHHPRGSCAGGAASAVGAQADVSQSLESSPSKAAKSTASAMREEIADQSMMVNAEKMFHRKEIPRKARKIA
jgi:transcription initiation factor TFIID subunit 8